VLGDGCFGFKGQVLDPVLIFGVYVVFQAFWSKVVPLLVKEMLELLITLGKKVCGSSGAVTCVCVSFFSLLSKVLYLVLVSLQSFSIGPKHVIIILL